MKKTPIICYYSKCRSKTEKRSLNTTVSLIIVIICTFEPILNTKIIRKASSITKPMCGNISSKGYIIRTKLTRKFRNSCKKRFFHNSSHQISFQFCIQQNRQEYIECLGGLYKHQRDENIDK
jgi:hypothetical protein